MTSCVRHPNGVDQLVRSRKGTANIIQFIQTIRDEEILANSAKILRMLLRSKSHYDEIVSRHKNLGNLLLDTSKLL